MLRDSLIVYNIISKLLAPLSSSLSRDETKGYGRKIYLEATNIKPVKDYPDSKCRRQKIKRQRFEATEEILYVLSKTAAFKGQSGTSTWSLDSGTFGDSGIFRTWENMGVTYRETTGCHLRY